MKKADVLGECPDYNRTKTACYNCSEYDECDNCGRRVCKWVAVHTESEDELICRVCAADMGWNNEEIATQSLKRE